MPEERTLVAALRAKLKDEELQDKLKNVVYLDEVVSMVGAARVPDLIDAARALYEEDQQLCAETLIQLSIRIYEFLQDPTYDQYAGIRY